METTDLPITLVSWGMALMPIVVLLVLLAGRQWKATQAGPIGMLVAGAVALFALQTPWQGVAVASGKGIWDAVYILYVVWGALLLYLVTDRAGGYDALRRGVTRISRNEVFRHRARMGLLLLPAGHRRIRRADRDRGPTAGCVWAEARLRRCHPAHRAHLGEDVRHAGRRLAGHRPGRRPG